MTTPPTGPAYGEGVHYHLPRRVRGLRVRVVATFVVAALVALAIALAAFTFGLRQILTSSAGDSATTEAQQVAKELSTTDDASAALRAAGIHTQVVQVLDASGALLATNDSHASTPLARPAESTRRTEITLDGDRDHYVVVTLAAHTRSGAERWVVAAAPIDHEDTIIDTTIVLLAPGAGDSIQAAKAGVLEIADVFVVNKADHDGAAATVRDLRAMISQRLLPLKDRKGRALSFDDVKHYQRILKILAETDRIMGTISMTLDVPA